MDYQATAAFLRDFRAAPQQVTPEVRRHAAEFASLCEHVNDRLRQCTVFLQQGLRSEAIHLAEESPNLLDMVASLDLPDPQGWADFCQQNDLPIPAPLQIERAEQLNAAYAQDQPLEQLFNRHRRLALARAPIRHRLQIMREIIALDTQSVWEKDIRTFEQARLRELKSAFSAAAREQDRERMLSLSQEVTGTAWLEPVPEDLLAAASQTEDHVKMLQLNAELEAMLDKLRHAFGARSLTQTSSLLDSCRALLDQHKTGVSADVAAELKPIMEWVKSATSARHRDQAFDHAAHDLRTLLDSEAPDVQLEAAYQKVREFNRPVPKELDDRYQQALSRRVRASQRRQRVTLLVIAAVVLLIMGGAWLYIRSNTSGSWARRISDAVTDRKLALAEQLVKEQHERAPQFNDNPDVIAARKKVEELRKGFDTDAASLKTSLDAAANALTTAVALPDSSSIDDLLGAFQTVSYAMERLEKAKQWAWADSGNELVRRTDEARAARDTLQFRIGRKAADEITAVAASVEAIPSAAADTETHLNALASLAGRITPLKSLPTGNDQATAAATELLGRIDKKRQELMASQSQTAELLDLRRQATSAGAWKTALELFTTSHPQAPIAADFRNALKAIPHSEALEAWQQLAAGWAADMAPPSEARANQRAKEIQDYLDKYPGSPATPQANRCAEYLKQAAGAMAMDGAWHTGLAGLLSQPLITDLKYLDSTDGTRYYVMGEPNILTRRLNDRVFITFDVLDPKNLTKRISVTVSPPNTLVSNKPQSVPHARFAESLAAQLKLISQDNWDSWGTDMADQLVKDDQITPVIKAAMLQQLLTIQRDVAGWALGNIYDRTIDDINRQRTDQVIWYDSERPVPQATLDALKKIFESTPKSADVRKRLAQAKADLFRAVRLESAGTGVLLRGNGGTTEAFVPTGLPPDAVAMVAVPVSGTTRPAANLVRIGQFRDGKVVLDDAAVAGLPQGTLVHFIKP